MFYLINQNNSDGIYAHDRNAVIDKWNREYGKYTVI